MALTRLLALLGSAAISSSASGSEVVAPIVGPTLYTAVPRCVAFVMLGAIGVLVPFLPRPVKVACRLGDGRISMFPRATGVSRSSATVIKTSGCSDWRLLPFAAACPESETSTKHKATGDKNTFFVFALLMDDPLSAT